MVSGYEVLHACLHACDDEKISTLFALCLNNVIYLLSNHYQLYFFVSVSNQL